LRIDDNVTTPQTTAIVHILYNCNNMQQQTHFYHTCLILPVVSTLTNGINKGYLKGFYGLTAQRVQCHIQINNSTTKGHMDQSRQGQCSMQPKPTSTFNATNLHNNDDVLPDLNGHPRHHRAYLLQPNRPFPHHVQQRTRAYLVIFYIYNANFIASVPIKNHTQQELLQAYQITYKYLSSCRFKPCLHRMDNKTSKDAKDFIQSLQTSLQYNALDIHCTNSAK
jgi:hypothetical protein